MTQHEAREVRGGEVKRTRVFGFLLPDVKFNSDGLSVPISSLLRLCYDSLYFCKGYSDTCFLDTFSQYTFSTSPAPLSAFPDSLVS